MAKKYLSYDRLQEYDSLIKAEIDKKVDANKVVVDSALSSTSVNPVQNKVIDAELDAIADVMGALGAAVDGKADSTHNHDSDYDAKGSASTSLAEAKAYTDTKTKSLASTSSVNTSISNHNTNTSAHNDIRVLITDLTTKLNNFLDVDDTTTDQLSEVLTLIENNKGTLESLTSNKINVADIVNNLTTNSTSKVLSAAQGVAIKALIDALQEELDGHTHAIEDVSGLQSALDVKADSDHEHDGYMLQENPTGTGAFSLNRKASTTIGDYSVALGYDTTASGNISFAEGHGTSAIGAHSHVEGVSSTASGNGAHAEGLYTQANADYSHAEGSETITNAKNTHAEGNGTVAKSKSQHTQGEFNLLDTLGGTNVRGAYAHILGNGTADDARSNAHTIDWSGNAWFAGNVYVGSTGGIDKDNGSKKLATEEYADSVASNKADKSLTVNVTKSGTTFSADTTFSVISAAIDNNTAVYVKYNNTIYYPSLKTAALITFRSHSSSSEDIINIMSSNVVTAAYSSLPVATEDSLGGIKSGGDISVGTDGLVTINSSIAIEKGGTGATTAADALTNLGALPLSGGTVTGQIEYGGTTEISSSTAYYRPILVSTSAPTASDGNIGDIWVQYTV